MIRVLFVCHGNICRSAMAEAMLKHMDTEGRFQADSAATHTDAIGYPMYSPARSKLAEYGIPAGNHRARQVCRSDYDCYDLIIGMDEYNIRNLKRLFNGDPENKVVKMMSYCGSDRDVADPWYTGDFEKTFQDLDVALKELLKTKD